METTLAARPLETKWFDKGRTLLILIAEHFTLHLYRREMQMIVDGLTYMDCADDYEKPPVMPWESERLLSVAVGDCQPWQFASVSVGPVGFALTEAEAREWVEALNARLAEPFDPEAHRKEVAEWAESRKEFEKWWKDFEKWWKDFERKQKS
jgi:hypothetical protein